ncbi:MAG: MoaD/ThiS family protein [Dethiobacteria bacterium]|nr:MoaD/ThiS family protein [Bacillota bacterium]HPZ64245.1 MoaD/ThiS family protein [Bacillota bacterium]
MIQVKVRYAGLPRSETGRSEETWELSEEATLQELVELICQKYRWPMEEKMTTYLVILNQQGADREEWPRKKLREGDQVLIISSIMGG